MKPSRRMGVHTHTQTHTHTHTHAYNKLKSALQKQHHIKTSSGNKESAPGGKQLHVAHLKDLKEKLKGCGTDLFSKQLLSCLSTGDEINRKVCSLFRHDERWKGRICRNDLIYQ